VRLPSAAAVNAERAAGDGEFGHHLGLTHDDCVKDLPVEAHRAIHVLSPDEVFEFFDVHVGRGMRGLRMGRDAAVAADARGKKTRAAHLRAASAFMVAEFRSPRLVCQGRQEERRLFALHGLLGAIAVPVGIAKNEKLVACEIRSRIRRYHCGRRLQACRSDRKSSELSATSTSRCTSSGRGARLSSRSRAARANRAAAMERASMTKGFWAIDEAKLSIAARGEIDQPSAPHSCGGFQWET